MWFFTKTKPKEPEYNQFLHQIREINRLEKEANKLHRFCLKACCEIYKHTGSHEWHEKLALMVKTHSAI